MKLNTNIAFGILIICITSCGYMNKVSIYEPSTSISAFDKFPQKILFTSSDENGLWGIKNNNCKQVSFETKNSYIGRDHLHIKWDASQCNYIGIGLKWDNYKGKNLKCKLAN